MGVNKRGAASTAEVEFILKNMDTMTDDLIAQSINRTVAFVKKIRIQHPVIKRAEESGDLITSLHAKNWWPETRRVCLEDEIRYFESMWASLNSQFEDVVPTDELILRDLIIYDILAGRNLVQQKNCMESIHLYQKLLDEEYDKTIENRDPVVIANLNQQLNSNRAAYLTLQKSYSEIDDRKNKAFQSLKATRDQRYKQLKESKHNFFDMVRELNSREQRAKEGRYAALFKEATDNERKKYEQQVDFTGNNDYAVPLLTPELIERVCIEEEKLITEALDSVKDINEK